MQGVVRKSPEAAGEGVLQQGMHCHLKQVALRARNLLLPHLDLSAQWHLPA
jgi:hypothetical protein